FVSRVSDQQDLVVVPGEPHRLSVHFRDERAGGVYRSQVSICCALHDSGRDAVSGEHDMRTARHLVDVVNEDRALLLKGGHHVDVVHDLLAHVDGRAVTVERLLDGDDRTVHSCTVTSG